MPAPAPAPAHNRIVDVTLYNGEPVLALRLAYLADHVDQFILVEARQTHAGTEKLPGGGLYSERPDVAAILALYGDKVRVVVLDRFPEMPEDWPAQRQSDAADAFMTDGSHTAWFREKYQRDFIAAELLAEAPIPAFYTICDIDEIPSTDVLRFLRTATPSQLRDPVHLSMKMYYYSFAWAKPAPWVQAFVVSNECLADLVAAGVTLSDVRIGRGATAATGHRRLIQNAGWHLSYFLTRADLRRKLASFAHRECDREAFKTDAHLDACFAEGRDLFGRTARDEQLVPTPPTEAADQMGPGATGFQDFLTLIQGAPEK